MNDLSNKYKDISYVIDNKMYTEKFNVKLKMMSFLNFIEVKHNVNVEEFEIFYLNCKLGVKFYHYSISRIVRIDPYPKFFLYRSTDFLNSLNLTLANDITRIKSLKPTRNRYNNLDTSNILDNTLLKSTIYKDKDKDKNSNAKNDKNDKNKNLNLKKNDSKNESKVSFDLKKSEVKKTEKTDSKIDKSNILKDDKSKNSKDDKSEKNKNLKDNKIISDNNKVNEKSLNSKSNNKVDPNKLKDDKKSTTSNTNINSNTKKDDSVSKNSKVKESKTNNPNSNSNNSNIKNSNIKTKEDNKTSDTKSVDKNKKQINIEEVNIGNSFSIKNRLNTTKYNDFKSNQLSKTSQNIEEIIIKISNITKNDFEKHINPVIPKFEEVVKRKTFLESIKSNELPDISSNQKSKFKLKLENLNSGIKVYSQLVNLKENIKDISKMDINLDIENKEYSKFGNPKIDYKNTDFYRSLEDKNKEFAIRNLNLSHIPENENIKKIKIRRKNSGNLPSHSFIQNSSFVSGNISVLKSKGNYFLFRFFRSFI